MAKDEKNKKNKDQKKSFLKESKAELKKVNWPKPKRLVNDTATVIGIVLIVAIIVFLLDFAFLTLNEKVIINGQEKIKNSTNNSIVVENVESIENTTETQNTENTAESTETTTTENTVTTEQSTTPENNVETENNTVE
ncbi:MAG: preprotein translocase subunit SecE [Clostridia bacterium]|nr:preprotein translocase subunit SecE [Clostridia bacterium]